MKGQIWGQPNILAQWNSFRVVLEPRSYERQKNFDENDILVGSSITYYLLILNVIHGATAKQ